MVRSAMRELQEQQRQEHYLQGLPVAQLTSLLFNINRDPKKGKATNANDWALFAPPERDAADELPAVVAHVCLALRHEEKLPPLLVGIWRHVVKQANRSAEAPAVRALVNEERTVVIVAPSWEGRNVRGFLASKGHQRQELVELVDIDRPLLRYRFRLPSQLMPVHFEAGVLVVSAEEKAVERLLPASSL